MANKLQFLVDPQAVAEENAPQILEDLVQQARRAGASDIHLQMDGPQALVCFRLDGLLTPPRPLPAPMGERVLGRIKYLARLKTYQESLPQDGRIDGKTLGGGSDIRVATYPTLTGEKAVLRLFTRDKLLALESLGFPEACRTLLEEVLHRTSGLIMLTGPSGSGKTTTIYSCLRSLVENQPGRHIITVEDPAEQRVTGVMQTEINEARGLDFACAARHLLRQDPQVLVIGEIRDEATASIAVRAALTGHLVITTLHAGSCRGVFDRLSTLCADISAIASASALVLNQRLLRKRCGRCEGTGCETCLRTGYRGRVAVVEWLCVNDSLRALIRSARFEGLEPTATLQVSADRLVSTGATTRDEAQRVLDS